MKNRFLVLTILALALSTGAAVMVEVLTLDPGSSLADACSRTSC